MLSNKRKGLSRTKTVGALKHSEAEYIQGVGGVTYSKLQHQEIQTKDSNSFVVALFVIQIFFLILYAIWTDYPETGAQGGLSIYGYFRDVNIMIFFGFGFLMTFMRRYAYSAIGYTFLISALVSQWSVLVQGYFTTIAQDDIRFTTWRVGIVELVNGLFCSGAVMISYGAILGKVTPSQMLILGFVEPLFYWLNIYVVIELLECVDVGGGMTIHTFGAYFGLAVTWFLTSIQTRTHKDNTNSYNSDIFSLAGTMFLWIMWPSFNAAVAPTEITQVRALVNTFTALCSSTMGAFLLTRLVSERKFDIVHIQNSTLAGGVAMGVVAHLHVSPVGAIVCGFLVSFISVLGYRYLTPFLSKRFNIQDVCGVNNLHGMPGIASCIIGIFVTLAAKESRYGSEYELLFPRGSQQAGYQTAGLFITIGIAVVGGCITGLLMARGWRIAGLIKSDFFNDRTFWTLPSDYENVIDKPVEEKEEKAKDEEKGEDNEPGSVELNNMESKEDKKAAKKKEAERKKEEKRLKEEEKKEAKKNAEKKKQEEKDSKKKKEEKKEDKKEEKEEKKEDKKDLSESSASESTPQKKASKSSSGSSSSGSGSESGSD